MKNKPQKACAYVDGFNLYYGMLLKNPEYKWLNVAKFLDLLLGPSYDIVKVKYFTAPYRKFIFTLERF